MHTNSTQLDELLRVATIPPAVNQVECHPLLPQTKLRDFCAALEAKLPQTIAQVKAHEGIEQRRRNVLLLEKHAEVLDDLSRKELQLALPCRGRRQGAMSSG